MMTLKTHALHTLYFLVLLFPVSAFCQHTDTLYKRLSIGINYESDVSYRWLNYSASNNWIKNIRDKEEIPKYGFSTGLNFKYRLNKKFALGCGILFTSKGMKTKKENLVWETPTPEYPVKSQTKFIFRTIDIPLRLNYNIYVGNTTLYVSAGISLTNFINRKTTITAYYSNGDKTKISDKQNFGYKSNTYSVSLGLGINLPLFKQTVLNIEPVLRYGITSIVEYKAAKEYLYAIGLNTTLFYQFKKRVKNT